MQTLIKASDPREEEKSAKVADRGSVPSKSGLIKGGHKARPFRKPGKKESGASIFRRSARKPLVTFKDPPPRKTLLSQEPGAPIGKLRKPLLGKDIYERTAPPTTSVDIVPRLITQSAQSMLERSNELEARRDAMLQVEIQELSAAKTKKLAREESVATSLMLRKVAAPLSDATKRLLDTERKRTQRLTGTEYKPRTLDYTEEFLV